MALGRKRGVESVLASGTADSVVALVDGELRAGSQVPAGVAVTTDFAQRLGDAKPIMVEGTPYGVESLIGHLVASVVTDARAKLGSDPGAVVFVHDDDLDDYRLGLWAEAGRLAGIPLVGLTLLSRSEALAQSVAGMRGDAAAASGAAKIGWANHPELVELRSGLVGGTVAGAAIGGAAVLGGGVIAVTVVGGGEAIAAGPAAAAGPVGSALSANAGPGGTSLSGPGGTSLSGPGGTSLSGPGGTPLARVIKAVKHSRRLQILGGGLVAVTVAVVAVAAGGNDPPTTPRTSGTTVVVDVTDSAATGTTGTTGVPPCTIGSWVMDNNSFAEMWLVLAGSAGLGVTLDSVTGSVSVDVNPEGEWTSTYTDWGFTSLSSEAGVTAAFSISITGTDSSTGTFSPDGSFSFATNSVNTTVISTVTVDGVNVPIPPIAGEGTVFAGTGTYECNDDTMTIQFAQSPTPMRMSRVL